MPVILAFVLVASLSSAYAQDGINLRDQICDTKRIKDILRDSSDELIFYLDEAIQAPLKKGIKYGKDNDTAYIELHTSGLNNAVKSALKSMPGESPKPDLITRRLEVWYKTVFDQEAGVRSRFGRHGYYLRRVETILDNILDKEREYRKLMAKYKDSKGQDLYRTNAAKNSMEKEIARNRVESVMLRERLRFMTLMYEDHVNSRLPESLLMGLFANFASIPFFIDSSAAVSLLTGLSSGLVTAGALPEIKQGYKNWRTVERLSEMENEFNTAIRELDSEFEAVTKADSEVLASGYADNPVNEQVRIPIDDFVKIGDPEEATRRNTR